MPTKPILLDSTGQSILTAAQGITAALEDVAGLQLASKMAKVAPDFSASAAYVAGDYVFHDGILCRFIADHAAGAWIGTDASAVVLADDVGELKSAFDDVTGNPSIPVTGYGAYIDLTSSTEGVDHPVSSSSAKYIVAPCSEGDQFVVSTVGGSAAKAYGFFESDKTTVISSSAANLTCVNKLVTAPANSAYFVANAVSNNDLRVIKNELLVDKVSGLYAALNSMFRFSSNDATTIGSNDDLNDYTTPGNYKAISNAIAASLSNCPVTAAFALKVMNVSTLSTVCQILIPNAPSTGAMWYRLGATASWRRITDDRDTITHTNVVLTSSNYSTYWPTGSFNEAQPNTIYGINEDVEGTFKNGPRGNGVTGQPQNQSIPDSPPATAGKLRGTVITYSQAASQSNQSGLVQLYIGYRETTYSPIFAYRTATYSGGVYTWSNWAKFEENGYLHAGNEIIFGGQPYIQNAPFTDLNDAPGNSIYHADKNMDGRDADHTLAHHPTPGYSSIIITYSFSYTTPHCRMQMVCSLDGRMFWRYGYLQATDDYRWTGWNQVAMDSGDIMRNCGRLDNGSDLDDVQSNGIWLLGSQSGAEYVNNPLSNGAGYLTVKWNAANSVGLQTVEAFSGVRYSRYTDDGGSTWSSWV